jgi:hypothetical protein
MDPENPVKSRFRQRIPPDIISEPPSTNTSTALASLASPVIVLVPLEPEYVSSTRLLPDVVAVDPTCKIVVPELETLILNVEKFSVPM